MNKGNAMKLKELVEMFVYIQKQGHKLGLADEDIGEMPICLVVDGQLKGVNFNIEIVKTPDGTCVLMEKRDSSGMIIVGS